MAVAIVITLFGSPFVAGLAQQAGLSRAVFLPETAQYRLHVWDVVSTRIAERPAFGWGFDSSPDLPTDDFQPYRPCGKVIPSHPHHLALQYIVDTAQFASLLVLPLLPFFALLIYRTCHDT